MKKLLGPVITLLLIVLVWMVFFWQPQKTYHAIPTTSSTLPPGGDFKLNTVNGNIELKDFSDKILLIYFGYTWCPDVCPTNLAMIAAALEQLSDTEKAKVQGLFISVDPERDTPERLADYGGYFHPDIMGATSTPEAIKEIADRYGAVYQKVKQDSATNYVVDHSSETYVVDTQGKLVERLPHAAPPDEIISSIKKYL